MMAEGRPVSFPEAARLLMAALEARGARFATDTDGALQVNVEAYSSPDSLYNYLVAVHYFEDHIKDELATRQRVRAATPNPILPEQLAVLLLHHLEARGAQFLVTAGGHLQCDLNGLGPDLGMEKAELYSHAVLGLADEIKTILAARSTLH